MKSYILKSLGLLAVLTCVSCSDDDSSDPITLDTYVSTPNTGGKSPVKGISRTGTFKDAYDWTFEYNVNGNMIAATSVRRNSPDGNDSSYDYTITYGTDNIVVATTAEHQMEFIVSNTVNMLEKAKSGNTEYHYFYEDGRLKSWLLTYYNFGFNASTRSDARADFFWSNGNLEKIVHTPFIIKPEETVTYTFEYNNQRNDNGILPELCTEAWGCKGFEFLHYAGLLGKPTTNLVNKITITDTKEPSNDKTYTFSDFNYYNDATYNLKHYTYQYHSDSATPSYAVVTYGY